MTDKKRSPFKTVSENLPFFPDMKKIETGEKEEVFEGIYVDSMILGDSPKQEENIPVYIFAKIETGEKFFIVQSYGIKKAIDIAKVNGMDMNTTVFSFDFKGKTTANGKPFNQFNTGYCTLEEYLLFKGLTEQPEESPKPKTSKK